MYHNLLVIYSDHYFFNKLSKVAGDILLPNPNVVPSFNISPNLFGFGLLDSGNLLFFGHFLVNVFF